MIGYRGVQPQLSFARPPSPWHVEDGKTTKLWGGWQDGVGHYWFHTDTGDVSIEKMSMPVGRDVFRAIDHPIVEASGGEIWQRIPDDALVAGDSLGGVDTAYPILILQKVWAVNDLIGETPFLIVYSRHSTTPESAVKIYDARLDGQRLTMGLTGYVHDNAPMLYDRGSTSLWVADGDTLLAVSGKYKGKRLKEAAHPNITAWSSWARSHPKCRLIVGADRERKIPDL